MNFSSNLIRKNKTIFINNQWHQAKAGTFETINPATEKVLATVSAGGQHEVQLAVQAAVDAFQNQSSFRRLSGQDRAKLLLKVAEELESNKKELAKVESADSGKPVEESIFDIDDAVLCLKYYANQAEKLDQEREENIEIPDDSFQSIARREPVGVVGAIIPWNFPLLMLVWKFAPCFAAGCPMILKPSELTPLSSLVFAEITKKVGIPAGAFNVVTGLGADAGAPLVQHPDVRKVAFTGSVATGSYIMKTAANDVKLVTLELGGKSPIVVFDDCDVEKVVEWVMVGIFFNQGEVCSATSRLLLQEGIAKRVLQRLKEEAEKLKVGDPQSHDTMMGCLVSKDQMNKVLNYIESGRKAGIKLLTGGQRIGSVGCFVQPTVFVDVPTDATIWQEEIFGPVLCVRTFKTEAEALSIANDTTFGLAAAVMSQDQTRAERCARELQAGIVWINCSQPTFTEAPWGGFKRSGIGRELGKWGLSNYLQTKQITKYSGGPWEYYLKSKL